MTTPDCESILMAALSLADDEVATLSKAQVEAHLADCPICRRDARELQSLSRLFEGQQRRTNNEELWARIAPQLPTRSGERQSSWYSLVVLGLTLLGWRSFELIVPPDVGWWFGLVPVAVVVAAFFYLKENPFRINTELQIER